MCLSCGFSNIAKEEEPPSPFDENDLNRITNDVWIGTVSVENLPSSVYWKTAKYLKEGLDKGFAQGAKADLIDIAFNSPDKLLLEELTQNIYLFSGAKTYQEVRAMSNLLLQPELKSSFYKFKEQATKVFNDYNIDYLQAEYQTSLASARMGAEWNRIVADADLLPLLEYDTIGDDRVRPTHRALDKIIRPVNDKFWSVYYPPNGWRCRCSVRQITAEEGEVTNLQGWLKPDDVPGEFKMNVGVDKYVFKTKGKDKHPYFKIAKKDKGLARNNFGFSIPL